MIFVNELFRIPFKREYHVPNGAPEDFYPNGSYQYLRYSDAEMDAFVSERPSTWPRDLAFIEKTVRWPDRCSEDFPQSVAEELNWNRRITLEREFEYRGKRYSCACKMLNVDGRFCVPLTGRYAPSIKEIPE